MKIRGKDGYQYEPMWINPVTAAEYGIRHGDIVKLYNVKPIRTKDIPYLDVLSESINNAIRFAIGWFCVTVKFYPPLSFVMGYWMAGAFLMASKRFAEYRMIADPDRAKLYRKSFGGYTELRLLLSAVLYGFLAVFFCGVFLIKYKIELILIIPFICGLFCYYLSICYF